MVPGEAVSRLGIEGTIATPPLHERTIALDRAVGLFLKAYVSGGEPLAADQAVLALHDAVHDALHERAASRRAALSERDIAHLAGVVDERLHERLAVTDLAAAVRLSPAHFARSFRAATGMTPWGFVTGRRLDRAITLIAARPALGLDEIARTVGFCDRRHLGRALRNARGVSPNTVRRTLAL
ncbi:MAG: helix-turn-helix domain-containing protein [Geminicoccaceae bacterium]